MGEATYYAKIQMPADADMDAAKALADEILVQGGEACDYWQKNRGKPPDVFWPGFVERFPLIVEYLEGVPRPTYGDTAVPLTGTTGDCNSTLAGLLDFVGESFEGVDIVDNFLLHWGYVWHFSDWTPLLQFLCKKLGAVAAGWISDEDMDPMSEIVLEEAYAANT